MASLIGIGAAVTLTGLALLIWSIIAVMRARNAGLDDEALRAKLARVMPVNLGALLLSALGLIIVIVGILLS